MRGEKNRITEFRPQANGELFPDNSEEKIEKMSGRSQHEEPAVSASVFVTVGTTSFDDLIHTLIYDDDVLQVSISKVSTSSLFLDLVTHMAAIQTQNQIQNQNQIGTLIFLFLATKRV